MALDDDALGITLGRPDYMERLEENPVAGLSYTKFMETWRAKSARR